MPPPPPAGASAAAVAAWPPDPPSPHRGGPGTWGVLAAVADHAADRPDERTVVLTFLPGLTAGGDPPAVSPAARAALAAGRVRVVEVGGGPFRPLSAWVGRRHHAAVANWPATLPGVAPESPPPPVRRAAAIRAGGTCLLRLDHLNSHSLPAVSKSTESEPDAVSSDQASDNRAFADQLAEDADRKRKLPPRVGSYSRTPKRGMSATRSSKSAGPSRGTWVPILSAGLVVGLIAVVGNATIDRAIPAPPPEPDPGVVQAEEDRQKRLISDTIADAMNQYRPGRSRSGEEVRAALAEYLGGDAATYQKTLAAERQATAERLAALETALARAAADAAKGAADAAAARKDAAAAKAAVAALAGLPKAMADLNRALAAVPKQAADLVVADERVKATATAADLKTAQTALTEAMGRLGSVLTADTQAVRSAVRASGGGAAAGGGAPAGQTLFVLSAHPGMEAAGFGTVRQALKDAAAAGVQLRDGWRVGAVAATAERPVVALALKSYGPDDVFAVQKGFTDLAVLPNARSDAAAELGPAADLVTGFDREEPGRVLFVTAVPPDGPAPDAAALAATARMLQRRGVRLHVVQLLAEGQSPDAGLATAATASGGAFTAAPSAATPAGRVLLTAAVGALLTVPAGDAAE